MVATTDRYNSQRKPHRFWHTIGCCALPCCSWLVGCVGHHVRVPERYSIVGTEIPVLSTPARSEPLTNDLQVTMLHLPPPPPRASKAQMTCEIEGSHFALSWNSYGWSLKSPSVTAWATSQLELDYRTEWKGFSRQLVSLTSKGCFGTERDVNRIKRAVIHSFSYPATESALFYYGLDADGFVDLVPGLTIEIEHVSGHGDALSPQDSSTAMGKTIFTVQQVDAGGVALHREKQAASSSVRATGLDSLGRSLQGRSFMRLFLGSIAADGSTRESMLLASRTGSTLELESDRIIAQGAAGCRLVASPETFCQVFGRDQSVSVFVSITVNRRKRDVPLGLNAFFLIQETELSEPEKAKALKSLSIERALVPNQFCEIDFKHTAEGARNVLLVDGDRVDWELKNMASIHRSKR